MSAVDRRVRRRLRQVGPQPRPARGGAHRRHGHRPAGRARPDPRRPTGCSTSCGPATPTSRSSRAPAAGPGSTSACSPAPTGSGPPTATTRSSGSPSSAGPGCSCHRSGWARTSARRARTRRTATSTCRCACSSPSAGTPGSSGTSPRAPPTSSRPCGRWSALYRELRPLLHGGDAVRSDHPDDAARGQRGRGAGPGGCRVHRRLGRHRPRGHPRHGAAARARPRPPVPGAGAARGRAAGHGAVGAARRGGTTAVGDGIVVSGAALGQVGLALPVLAPAQGFLLHLETATDSTAAGGTLATWPPTPPT